MGRQPWVVQNLLFTSESNSPSVSGALVATSFIGFTLLYGVLAGVAGWIAVRIIKAGPEPEAESSDAPATATGGGGTEPSMAY
jgi:cytochrome d ubiquinol oxidase subunit I